MSYIYDISNLRVNIRPVGAEMLHADRRDEANSLLLFILQTRLKYIYYRI
jgi:hypothetical protein